MPTLTELKKILKRDFKLPVGDIRKVEQKALKMGHSFEDVLLSDNVVDEKD